MTGRLPRFDIAKVACATFPMSSRPISICLAIVRGSRSASEGPPLQPQASGMANNSLFTTAMIPRLMRPSPLILKPLCLPFDEYGVSRPQSPQCRGQWQRRTAKLATNQCLRVARPVEARRVEYHAWLCRHVGRFSCQGACRHCQLCNSRLRFRPRLMRHWTAAQCLWKTAKRVVYSLRWSRTR